MATNGPRANPALLGYSAEGAARVSGINLPDYARLADSLPQPAWVLDERGNAVYYNRPWTEYTGVTLGVVPPWGDVLHPDDVQPARELWAASLATRQPFRVEYRLKARDGSYRWHLARAEPVQAEAEGPLWFGTCTDIDDARRATQGLQHAEQRLRVLIANAPVVLWAVDTEGRVTLAQGQGLTTAGLDAERILGQSVYTLFADNPGVTFLVQRALHGEVLHSEVCLGDAWFEVHCAPLRDERDITCGVMGFSVDMTARKQSAQVWAHSARLEALVDTQQQIATASLDPDALMTLVAERALSHVEADAAFVYLLEGDELVLHARAGDDVVAVGFRTPLTASFSGFCVRENRAVLSNEASTDVRVDARVRGFHLVGSAMAVPVRGPEGAMGVLGVTCRAPHRFDAVKLRMLELLANLMASAVMQARALLSRDTAIASLRAVERRLTQAKIDAEAAADAKTDFLASMSHEIRTPLNGVIGMTDILLETPLNPQQTDYLRIVQSSGTALLTIVNDILDFSKIEAGKLTMEDLPVDIQDVIDNQVALVAALADEKGLRLSTVVDPRLLQRVRGDPTRIGQAILNFLGNAIKFTRAGSVTTCATLEHEAGRAWLQVAVTDTGIGISPEAQKRLFKPFSQGHGSTARQYGGTGLGLSITKKLVELMQGTVGLTSSVGRGSTFWLRLPADDDDGARIAAPLRRAEPAPVPRAITPGTNDANRGHILVCDDNPVNQRVATALLQGLGFVCDVADNGREALRALEGKVYDLILMDCQMPEMDGYEAVARIRADEMGTGRHVPVVALTASALAEDRTKCVASGMDDYLTKPIKRQHLQHALQRWLPSQN